MSTCDSSIFRDGRDAVSNLGDWSFWERSSSRARMVEYEFRHVFARILLTALILGPTDLWCPNSKSKCFLSCVGPNLNQQTFEIENEDFCLAAHWVPKFRHLVEAWAPSAFRSAGL